MKNIAGMMKKAKQLQDKIAKIQEEVGQKTVEASAGGGVVTAVVNGQLKLLEVKIAPEAVEDLEMLQDMIVAAVGKAQDDAKQMMDDAMGSVTGNLGLPGMF